MTLNVFSIFKLNFDCIEVLLKRSKGNSYGIYVVKQNQGREILYSYKKSICITVNLCLNSSETNHLDESKIDNVIRNSNLPCIIVHTKSLLKNIINMQKKLIHSQLLVSMMK